MTWALVVVGTAAAAELLLRLPLVATARRLMVVVSKVGRTLRSSGISDHWKEKVLLRYAVILFRLSLLLFALLLTALMPVGLVSVAGEAIGRPVLRTFMTPAGLLASLAAAALYLAARSAIVRHV